MAGRLFGYQVPRIKMGINFPFAGEAISLEGNPRNENGEEIIDVIFLNIGEPHNLLKKSVPVEHIENWEIQEKQLAKAS